MVRVVAWLDECWAGLPVENGRWLIGHVWAGQGAPGTSVGLAASASDVSLQLTAKLPVFLLAFILPLSCGKRVGPDRMSHCRDS